MARLPFPDPVHTLLAAPNPAVITTLRSDGQPVSVATGTIIEMYDDVGLADIDRLSRHYRGRDYAVRDRRRVSALVEVDRWHGWEVAREH